MAPLPPPPKHHHATDAHQKQGTATSRANAEAEAEAEARVPIAIQERRRFALSRLAPLEAERAAIRQHLQQGWALRRDSAVLENDDACGALENADRMLEPKLWGAARKRWALARGGLRALASERMEMELRVRRVEMDIGALRTWMEG